MAKWTEEEIQYLKDNYIKSDINLLSEKLKRSKDTIYNKAGKIGLHKHFSDNYIGKKYGMLTVIGLTGKKAKFNKNIYLCICDCGNKHEVTITSLINGNTKSCGCLYRDVSISKIIKFNKDNLKERTNLNIISREKANKNSKSGIRGVHYSNSSNYWIAQISFKGEKHHLGYFKNKQDAIKARKLAEEKYFEPVLEKYGKEETK